MNKDNIPVITVDGPTGSGKGTLSFRLAKALGWHYLESGIFYRLLALLAFQRQVDLTNEVELVSLCHQLSQILRIDERADKNHLFLENREVTERIREEDCAAAASKVSALPSVREALMSCQKMFRRAPGLVTDGRDMGTVVFPDAKLKLFLKADPRVRAERRYLQLKQQGINGNLPDILEGLLIRDHNDSQRAVAPLRPASDAVFIETTAMNAEEVFRYVMELCRENAFIKEVEL